jgi:hypothetical protein
MEQGMKSAQAEATARPWHVNDGTMLVDGADLGAARVLGFTWRNDSSFRQPDTLEAVANAALIVRCVNGYEALEARVRELEAALRWAMEHAEWSSDTDTGTDPIRAALKST